MAYYFAENNMMNNRKMIVAVKNNILFLALLAIGFRSSGQSSYGYIDYEQVVRVVPEYAELKEKMDLKMNSFQDSMDGLVSCYYDLLQKETPHNKVPDSTYTARIEMIAEEFEKKLEDFVALTQSEMETEREAMQSVLLEIISKELKIYSLSNSIVCIVNKDQVLYCLDCIDYTDDFILYLSRNK
ncbi:MAG: OmpH family outer membrane protein [Chitinophagales bacterium]